MFATKMLFTVFALSMSVSVIGNIIHGSIRDKFEDWVSYHHMHFEGDVHEESTFAKWLVNDKYIDQINIQNLTYTLGHNQFSGMDSDEFGKFMTYSNKELRIDDSFDKIHNKNSDVMCLGGCIHNYNIGTGQDTVGCVKGCLDDYTDINGCLKINPSSIDWVSNGAVSPVKNQGQCGSCWSFSTTGALEGAYFVTYGTLPSFSEQQLVDCDTLRNGGKDHGCNGGLMDNAFSWIKHNGGLCSEANYPYVSGTTTTGGSCNTTCNVITNSDVSGWVDVPHKSDDEMMNAVAQQPVSVAIEADQQSFQLYKSGVFIGDCGTNLDHGVLVVGYGTDSSGNDYYRIKNSWGTTWGDEGYIYIGRGSEYNNGQGQCGVLLQASYPLL